MALGNGKDPTTIVWKCEDCHGVNINFTDWCLHCGFVPEEEPDETSPSDKT